MRFYLAIFLILLVYFLIVPVAANDLGNSTITSSQQWIIANGRDQSTITVTAIDANYLPQPGIPVTFSLDPNSRIMGTLSPSTTLTDSYGRASTKFTANKTSGSATIKAALNYNGNITNLLYVQQIDHDVPFFWNVTSPTQATVGTETYFNVTYTDQWGNVIDSRNPSDPNVVSLQIGSVSGNAAFDTSGTFATSTARQLDSLGRLSVKVRLDTITGQNNIHIQPFYPPSQGGSIPDVYPYILGIANGVPASIVQTVSPDPPTVPADMTHTITIDYILYDKYGNPTTGQSISILTTAGDWYPSLLSNEFGHISYTTSRGSSGNITVTATTLGNSSVSCNKTLTFYSTAPVNWALSADPQTMPSLDANTHTFSNITAQVTDVMGNPVSGQTVTFSLGAPTYDDSNDIITSDPRLTAVSAVTDSNGNAAVQFIPGGFSTNSSLMHYNSMATGNISVMATWGSEHQSVQLTWKNYPYLSAWTSIFPSPVAVNGTVNVTVKLTGDGWALRPNPIDVVLLIDRSGSMSNSMCPTGQTRNCPTSLSNAQAGAKGFIAQINSSNDRIAVASYSGMTNGNNVDTTVGSLTSSNSNTLNTTINNIQASGATGTRDGLYRSIKLLKDNPNSNSKAVRAVILLTDGNYNWLGNPLGRGTGYSPAPPTGYTGYSGSTLEPEKYLYYSGLGGTLNPALAADFIGSTTGNPRQVQFTDRSTGTPTSWSWDFGDSTSSTLKNPQRTYAHHGSTHQYSVTETVNYGSENRAITQTNYVSVSGSDIVTLNTFSSTPVSYSTGPDMQTTEQNMSVYAANNSIRLYTISYANTLDDQAISDMKVLANSTGGFYANAPDAATLAILYTKIAGNLQTAAGVNTQMNLNFQNVNLSGVTVPNANVYRYVAANPGSTDITWQDGVTNNTDQSPQWNLDKTLKFNIGTINLGQTWQATFRLNISQAGSIELFGSQSAITFNGGTDTLIIPPKYIYAVNNLTNTVTTTQSILLNDLTVTQPGAITDFVPLQWNTTYPGNSINSEERVYYSTVYQQASSCGGSQWQLFDKQSPIPAGDSRQFSRLDARSLPTGTYYFCVLAQADDALNAKAMTLAGVQVGKGARAYIKLE